MRLTRDVSPRVAQSLLMCGALMLSSAALSAETIGRGFLSVGGSILETACDIAVGDRDQALVMDVVSIGDIARGEQGPSKEFSIRLVDCLLMREGSGESAWQRFAVTFDGERDRDYFAVTGTASGIALAIRDARGAMATPGIALPERTLASGEKKLSYTVAVVANQQPLRSGDYRSAIRFTMDYY